MHALDFVNLTSLMDLTSGRSETVVGLIDGPVVLDHPDLAGENIREIPGEGSAACDRADTLACLHGTFVAGILSAKRSSAAPAICPNCTLLLRPIFSEAASPGNGMPGAPPLKLAEAIIDCIKAGARVINMSLALSEISSRGERALEDALGYAVKRGVLVVAAAGNQAAIGSSGLSAPGQGVTSLKADGETFTSGGTSIAAPFVTGAIALLWSEFPAASAARVKLAVTNGPRLRRRSIVPPVLDAWAAYQILKQDSSER